MLQAQDIIDQVLSRLEDTSGNYYNVEENVVPAINDAIEWIVSIITPYLTAGSYREELFADIMRVLVFQTSQFGRVNIDPDELGLNVWKIPSVYPKPYTYIEDSTLLRSLPYFSEIKNYIGKEYQNRPIITKKVDYTNIVAPDPGSGLTRSANRQYKRVKAHESILRPEMAMSKAGAIAEEMPYDTAAGGWNPFEAGSKKNAELFGRYAFAAPRKFNNYMIGGYELSAPKEIEIFPHQGVMIVGVGIIETPELITFSSDMTDESINLPDRLKSVLINKTLSIISTADGDTAGYQITEREVVSLIQAASI